MPFQIATMSFAAKSTTVTHTNKILSPSPWTTLEVWSPGANKFTKKNRWVFTTPVAVGNSHVSTLSITGVDAADDADISASIGMQMTLRVGFGNGAREYLYLNLIA